MAHPTKIDVHPEGFFIAWEDSHESMYPSRYLRGMCGCAICVSELTGVRMVTEAMVPEDIHAVGVEPMGNYAIHIGWSDGHTTGIYPFERLRQICPCAACRSG